MSARCPTCQQPLPSRPAVRICRLCKLTIMRHDKWRFVTVRGKTLVEHRHCNNPGSYLP